MNVKLSFFLWVTLLFAGAALARTDPVKEAEMVSKSVVRIEVVSQVPNFAEPWNAGGSSGGVGTGFIIEGKRIITNAHVVSNALMVRVVREGNPKQYDAKVKHIAHDCDLAILAVQDTDGGFFKGSAALEFGAVPKLNSSVAAYGYPIGGKRMSITKGIVSRIEFNAYSHSGLDSHLTIQVDAAINPGNSGGPIVQAGKVVGVAFQGYSGSVAQSTGYMIPTPVVNRMLKDVEDGSYDGYMELAIFQLNLQNASMRKYLGLPDNDLGVLVTDVIKGGSADGILKQGDVLLKVDGYDIDSTGNITLDGRKVQLAEVVERKFSGDTVRINMLRDGKPAEAVVSLKKADAFRIYAWSYDRRPRFVMVAGMVFQPVDRNLMRAHGIEDDDVKYNFDNFIRDGIFLKRPELVVLSSVLPDPVNNMIKKYAHRLVDRINGVEIKTLDDIPRAFKKAVKQHEIRLHNIGRPIIIDADMIPAARQRILERYQIPLELYLGDEKKEVVQ